MNYEGYDIRKDGTVYGKRGQKMCPSDNGKGYLILGLMVNGRRITKAVHRLVAEVHLPNPLNLPEVDHVNDDRSDNRLENLMWLTKEQNVQKSYDVGDKTSTGEMNGRCTTSEKEVREICELLSKGKSSSEIRDMGYPYNLVRAIKAKKNWREISESYF